MADLLIKIKGDSVSAENALKKTDKALGKTAKQTKKTATAASPGLSMAYAAVAGVMTGVVAAAFKKVIGLATDFEESNAKFGVVFRGTSKQANAMRKELVRDYGISSLAATEMLAGIQDFLVPMGVARQEATKLSGKIAVLARDLGSFNNQPTADVLKAIQSALSGITMPMKRFGVDVSQAGLQQLLMNEGIDKSIKSLSRAEKAQLIYRKIVADSADAIDDFKRTSDSFANTLVSIKAVAEDVTLVMGQQMLAQIAPTIAQFGKFIRSEKGLKIINKLIKATWLSLVIFKETLLVAFRPMAFMIKVLFDGFMKIKELIGKQVVGVFIALFNKVKIVMSFIGKIVGFVGDRIKDALRIVAKGFKIVGIIIKMTWDNIMRVVDALQSVSDKVRSIVSFVGKMKDKVVSFASKAGSAIKGKTGSALDSVKGKTKEALDVMGNYWKDNKNIITGGIDNIIVKYNDMMETNKAATIIGMNEIVEQNKSAADAIKKTWRDVMKDKLKSAQKWVADHSDILKGFAAAFESMSKNLTEISKNRISKDLQATIDANAKKLADGEITQEQFDENDAKFRKEAAKRFRKAAIAEKATNIALAGINAAAAILKTMASVPFPVNVPLAIAQGAAGAIQVAKIASTPLPELKLAHGGEFTTNGEQSITVGDNPSGRERVSVTPEESLEDAQPIQIFIDSLVVQTDSPENFGEQMKEFGILTARRA